MDISVGILRNFLYSFQTAPRLSLFSYFSLFSFFIFVFFDIILWKEILLISLQSIFIVIFQRWAEVGFTLFFFFTPENIRISRFSDVSSVISFKMWNIFVRGKCFFILEWKNSEWVNWILLKENYVNGKILICHIWF